MRRGSGDRALASCASVIYLGLERACKGHAQDNWNDYGGGAALEEDYRPVDCAIRRARMETCGVLDRFVGDESRLRARLAAEIHVRGYICFVVEVDDDFDFVSAFQRAKVSQGSPIAKIDRFGWNAVREAVRSGKPAVAPLNDAAPERRLLSDRLVLALREFGAFRFRAAAAAPPAPTRPKSQAEWAEIWAFAPQPLAENAAAEAAEDAEAHVTAVASDGSGKKRKKSGRKSAASDAASAAAPGATSD